MDEHSKAFREIVGIESVALSLIFFLSLDSSPCVSGIATWQSYLPEIVRLQNGGVRKRPQPRLRCRFLGGRFLKFVV